MLRILVCSKSADEAKQIYLKAVEIIKAFRIQCELSYAISANAFTEGKNPRNQPYDVFILDSTDPDCINLAAVIRKKNLLPSIIFFNYSDDNLFKRLFMYRPSFVTFLEDDNKDLSAALRWCHNEQLRAHPYFSVKNKDVQMRINYDTIPYFESRQRIVILHTHSQAIEFYAKLSDVYATLPDSDFIRCHQSYIVNMHHVKSLDKTNRLFILSNGAAIEISKSQYSYVLSRYEEFASKL